MLEAVGFDEEKRVRGRSAQVAQEARRQRRGPSPADKAACDKAVTRLLL